MFNVIPCTFKKYAKLQILMAVILCAYRKSTESTLSTLQIVLFNSLIGTKIYLVQTLSSLIINVIEMY